jgi:hypothetical protein
MTPLQTRDDAKGIFPNLAQPWLEEEATKECFVRMIAGYRDFSLSCCVLHKVAAIEEAQTQSWIHQ